MNPVLLLGLFLLTIPGCTGFGVQDAEMRSRAAHADWDRVAPPSSSIWSMFGSSGESVRKRLDPGLGKAKTDQIAALGEPFGCAPVQTDEEICGWYDQGMSDSKTVEASRHQVFYLYNQRGIARQWLYRGLYGKYTSLDLALPAPSSATPPQ